MPAYIHTYIHTYIGYNGFTNPLPPLMMKHGRLTRTVSLFDRVSCCIAFAGRQGLLVDRRVRSSDFNYIYICVIRHIHAHLQGGLGFRGEWY